MTDIDPHSRSGETPPTRGDQRRQGPFGGLAEAAVIALALVAVACSSGESSATVSSTPTTAAAGSDEAATTAGADFDVRFDGEECTVTGPESVPAGEYTVVLTDTSGLDVDVDVAGYDDGHTFADIEEYIEETGGDGDRRNSPGWAPSVMRDFEAPLLDLADNQSQYDYLLEAGSHGVVVFRAGGWGCAGFEVT